uniref:Uncharacterized protein LOC114329585 n=1 Tax=Diabrotica virgifera virgifera TaxID=50390 RepID=A0A6P7FHV6_DIAVI
MALSAASLDNHLVLLSTLQVYLVAPSGKRVFAKALLDSASQVSFISADLVKELSLTTRDGKLRINGINSTSSSSQSIVDTTIFAVANDVPFDISCSVLPKITNPLPQISISASKLNIPSEIPLGDPMFHVTSPIGILLGADLYNDIIQPEIIRLGKGLPVLQRTLLGYTISGSVPDFALKSKNTKKALEFYSNSLVTCCSHNTPSAVNEPVVSNEELYDHLQKFWELEEDAPQNTDLINDHPAEINFVKHVNVPPNGRYESTLNLKLPIEDIDMGNSLLSAKRRFLSLEKRFQLNPDLLEKYQDTISEYLNNGQIIQVPLKMLNDSGKPNYFLPHFHVFKSNSTTSTRIVFDPNNKSSTGISLSDVIDKGYVVQHELFNILAKFRQFKFALVGDIKAMFLQIAICPTETFLLNFLFRDNIQQPLRCYQFQRLPFGLPSSPFIAQRVIKHIADNNKHTHELATSVLQESIYMDDLISGADSLHELSCLFEQLTSLLETHGFLLHKWNCSSSEFLSQHNLNPISEVSLNFTGSDKVLGIF